MKTLAFFLVLLSGAAAPSGAGPAVSDGPVAAELAATPRAPGAAEPVRLEYIAHASFRIESPGGARVVIDPFNSNIWLGYSFPVGLDADAVLVSHPHYDHDATYYFDDVTPVFRTPGEYRVGDVALRGIESEHAGRARFQDRGQTPFNTIWLVETGGLRIAHLGDNRLLNELDLEAMGPVDVILMNAVYFDAVNIDMLTLLLETVEPDVLVPMHYRHEGLSELPGTLRPVSDYVAAYDSRNVEGNAITLDVGSLDEWQGIVVLQPSPDVEPWPSYMHDAWVEAGEGAGMLTDSENEQDAARAEEALWEGTFHYEAAIDLAPSVLRFGLGAGRALALLGQVTDAIETLDHALARAPQGDWTDRLEVHMLLGELYELGDHPEIAVAHYEYVATQRHTHETELRNRALQRLEELRQRP